MPNLLDRWRSRFEHAEIVREQEQEYDSREWLVVFDSKPFQVKVMRWLETEINKPTKLGQPDQMVAEAIRSNTLKEIRLRLVQDAEAARRILTNE